MDLASLQHSLFLGALGNALLNSLWQGFILWVVYETVIISYKNAGAKFKHNLSVLLIFGSFIWFISSLIPNLLITQKGTLSVSSINNLETTGAASLSPLQEILSVTGHILPYLSVAYIFLLFFLMVKLFTAYRHVHFIAKNNLIDPPAYLKIFAGKVASQLAIPKKIKVWISHHIEVPATVGFIKPVILIPFASINNLTVHQLEAIILHELSHIKRNDYLVNLFISVIETILFFNPFVVIFIKIIRRERENCCDDFVLQYRYDPQSYASALLRLEQSRRNNVSLALGAVSGKKQLLSRIKRITGTHIVTPFNYVQKLLALFITTGIFCSLAWLPPSGIKKEVKNISPKENNTIPHKPQLEIIAPLSKISEDKITIAKNKINEEKIKNDLKIKSAESSQSSHINVDNEEEKNKLPAENFFNEFSSANENPLSALNQNNHKEFVFKKISEIENLNFNLNEEINKGIKQVYTEIGKINWRQVQNEINKSLSEIKVDELPEKQKADILKARKYLSLINLDKQQLNVSTIVKEIQQQQKLTDSLRAAGATLENQLPSRLAESHTRSEWQTLNNLAPHFLFNYDNQIDANKEFKRNNTGAPNAEAVIELNGRRLKINSKKNPSHYWLIPPSIKRIKGSQRIIIDI